MHRGVTGDETARTLEAHMNATAHARRPLTAVLIGLLLAATLAACTTATPNPTPDPGSLTVTVTGLDVGVAAAVTVTGPGGYVQAVTATTTLTGLTPGVYSVTAAAVDDGQRYVATVNPALVNVPEGGTATSTVTYAAGDLVNDGDSSVDPGLWARFRNTSGAPVWVDRLLFNEATPLDVKGVQLRNEVGDPDDPEDWVQFELVHGDSPTTTITVTLDCPVEERNGAPFSGGVRAQVQALDGTPLTPVTLCGESQDYAIANDGGTTEHRVRVYSVFGDPFYARYTLSIDAYCFNGCTYAPFEP